MSSLLSRVQSWFRRPYRSVSPKEAARMLGEGAVLIDVRERGEFEAGHAPQARHVALRHLPDRMSSLPRSRTVVLVCRSGARSSRAAQLLARQGFDAINLTGGMNAWDRAGLPVVRGGGRRRTA